MNKKIFFLLVSLLILTSCAPRGTPPHAGIGTNTILGACEKEGSKFADKKTLPFAKWAETYHRDVNDVVKAHMNAIRGAVKDNPLKCTAQTLQGLLQPTRELRNLAETLPPWKKDKKGNASPYVASLSEADIGSVLLEYLRVYECALKERKTFLIQEVLEDLDKDPDIQKPINFAQLSPQEYKEQKQISDELVAARAALNRTLTIIGSLDRLRPITLELECIQRASLDLRNALGLAADTTACLPRILDARGSLRDLSPE